MFNGFQAAFQVVTLMVILLVAASWAGAGLEGDPGRQKTFILAKVGDNPKKVYPRLKPLAVYLASRLTDQGIVRGDVMVAPDNQTMVSWLRQGRVDLVTETPFSAVYFQERAKAIPVARGWRRGVPSYHSIIFVHKESLIQEPADLVGRVIAFEDRGSTSAYYLPAADLISQGYAMAYLSSVREEAPAEKVGYVFSGEEINSTTWVHKKLVAAAALSNLDWESDEAAPQGMKGDLRIIYRTPDFPRSVERLGAELYRAHSVPEGLAAMKRYKNTTRFDPVDEATRQSLESARVLYTVVREHLE
ncbi:phosphate/phosphite/phosphonate ABC transporter substrate-binding protein [Desulfogranum mediterraneum]|uniref:phosphate/phosphite/phosphonate ABC transporter substrate-binding protein n=1 Tax=Desulfogranum mediterraneum TaxID=160661 RepID=UPI000683F942|nr:phosphate/phosphite/phosphonate ABC transporter substrate-binding protein [Desulfogranum mediterraneum]